MKPGISEIVVTSAICDSGLPCADMICGTVTSVTAPLKPIGRLQNPVSQIGNVLRLPGMIASSGMSAGYQS